MKQRILAAALALLPFLPAVAAPPFTTMPYTQLSTDTNGYFAFIETDSPSGYTDTVFAAFTWLDAYIGTHIHTPSNIFTHVWPTSDTHQAYFDALDEAIGSLTDQVGTLEVNAGTNFIFQAGTMYAITNDANNQWYLTYDAVVLKGTNIIGATYDPATSNWTINSQTAGLLPGSNIVGATYNTNDLQWTVNTVGLSPVFDVWSTNETAIPGGAQTEDPGLYHAVVTNVAGWGFDTISGVFTSVYEGYYFFVANARYNTPADNHGGLGIASEEWTSFTLTPYSSKRYPYTAGNGGDTAAGIYSEGDSLFKYMEVGDTMMIWHSFAATCTNFFRSFQGFYLGEVE